LPQIEGLLKENFSHAYTLTRPLTLMNPDRMTIFVVRTEMYGGVTEGGSFSLLNGFLSGVNALGHRSHLLSSGPMKPPPETAFHLIPYQSWLFNVPELPTLAYARRFVRQAARLFREQQPDFVYMRHTAFNTAAALMKREFGVKVVLQCDSSEVWVKRTWGKVYFDRLLRLAEALEFSAADGMTVISEEVREQLVDAGADPAKILVNPNGVDPQQFSPHISGDEVRRRYGLEGHVVCGFAGSFDVVHGLGVLATAMQHIKREVPTVKFLYVGDGKLRADVERIAQETGMSGDVILTGMIPHAEVASHLAACDILYVPAIHNSDGSEFFCSPIKLFEYMAMRKPVIASGIGPIKDIVRHNSNGVLVQPNDPEALARETARLVHSPELAQTLALQARADVVASHTWTQNAQRVIDFARR
jgi:glycosyltransferase involved in cell wall biosynthesis